MNPSVSWLMSACSIGVGPGRAKSTCHRRLVGVPQRVSQTHQAISGCAPGDTKQIAQNQGCLGRVTKMDVYNPGSPVDQTKWLVFGMMHVKDSLLPMGKVWSAWTSSAFLYAEIDGNLP